MGPLPCRGTDPSGLLGVAQWTSLCDLCSLAGVLKTDKTGLGELKVDQESPHATLHGSQVREGQSHSTVCGQGWPSTAEWFWNLVKNKLPKGPWLDQWVE